ncbi:MAG: hypothetical protein AAFX81_16535 [Pseudomonadota bacterium]
MTKPWQCGACGKRFTTEHGARQHSGAKHQGRYGFFDRRVSPKGQQAQRHSDEPSIASLMVQAEIDRACGEPVDDWLADMLP